MIGVKKNSSLINIDTVIILLALASLGLLSYEIYLGEKAVEQMRLIQAIDVSIALIFLGEFIYRLIKAPRPGVFMLYNWWQLLAAIPVTTLATQALRGLMLLRVVIVIARFFVPLAWFFSFLTKSRIAPVLSIFLFIFLVGSLSFHLSEWPNNPHIEGYWDSVHFSVSMVTNTGVNFGPSTLVGEIASVVLMLTGVLTLGVFTAFIASYIIHQRRIRERKKS